MWISIEGFNISVHSLLIIKWMKQECLYMHPYRGSSPYGQIFIPIYDISCDMVNLTQQYAYIRIPQGPQDSTAPLYMDGIIQDTCWAGLSQIGYFFGISSISFIFYIIRMKVLYSWSKLLWIYLSRYFPYNFLTVSLILCFLFILKVFEQV